MARKYNDVLFVDITSGLMIIERNKNKSGTRKIYDLVDVNRNVLLSDSNPIVVYQLAIMKIEELEKVDNALRK